MAFNKCPVEINQMIALKLSDWDLCTFRFICPSTKDAIDADHDRFWFDRFRQVFDPPRRNHLSHTECKQVYQARRRVMRTGMVFRLGHGRAEQNHLVMIQNLIIDAVPSIGEAFQPVGRNITVLQQILRNSNLLDCIFHRTSTSRAVRATRSANNLLPLIQLVLSSQALQLDNNQIWAWEQSQKAAYLSAVEAPIFTGFNGLDVNIEWALHMVNFFRHHMLLSTEYTLHNAYKAMDKKSGGLALPQYWKEQLSNLDRPTPLGKYWKGTYAYLERSEVNQIRRSPAGLHTYQDKNIENGASAVQKLHIEFPEEPSFPWPKLFEEHLNSQGFHNMRLNAIPAPTRTRAQHRTHGPAPHLFANAPKSRRFEGTGYDDEEFFSCGWLNPLPPQQGIPGFQRMTMMKFFKDSGTGLVDIDALWAYEGVVLPGGQIIVGRWWSPEDSSETGKAKMYCGPFILWNTDAAEAKKQKDKEAKQIQQLGIAM